MPTAGGVEIRRGSDSKPTPLLDTIVSFENDRSRADSTSFQNDGDRTRSWQAGQISPLTGALSRQASAQSFGAISQTHRRSSFAVSVGDGAAPRLLDRTANFHQSDGRLKIRRVNRSHETTWLRMKDIFHSLVNMSTKKVVPICAGCVVSSWVVFAFFFRLLSHTCDLRDDTFLKALYLSIETIETIGYGVHDPYYNNCTGGVFILGAACIWGSLLNAVIIGIVYTRISRAHTRASSVCFSEKAVIAEVDGKFCFMFQVCDFRKHQLVEAHVRLYCVRHADSGDGTVFQTRYMRLLHPDDELGGMLLLALPQQIVHGIDQSSPLFPQSPNANCFIGSVTHRAADSRDSTFSLPPARQVTDDQEAHQQQCGESPYGLEHVTSLGSIAQHVRDGAYEVLCIVEGIDPSTSNTLQARYSYTCDDIVFNASFQRCVTRSADGMCEVNFDAFHEIIESDKDPSFVGFLVQSMP